MSDLVIIGTGSCLPERVLSNQDLEKLVNTSDEWITTRTGIKTRRIAGRGEKTSELSTRAAVQALEMAGVEARELDMVMVATITPEMTMPSCACQLQQAIGASRAFAFDLNAACSGFLYGMDIAARYVRCDPEKKILLVGAETLSSRLNWQDRNTCILFGDGAGAAVLGGSADKSAYFASELHADGGLWSLLYMNAAPSLNPELQDEDNNGSYIRMNGREVFRHAVRSMESVIASLMEREGYGVDDIDLFVPHQANVRILDQVQERFGFSASKVYVNVDRYGNTSAASIPIALDEASRSGRLRRGDLVLICAFGGGFTWGAGLLRW